jgi:hypothetical protein
VRDAAVARMQVRSPVNRNRSCAAAARGFCFVRSMASAVWQLRHSRLSFASIRAHSRSAMVRRWSRKSSRVLIVPKMWPHTSFEACILRAILSVQSCGTWQVGQPERTPERFT